MSILRPLLGGLSNAKPRLAIIGGRLEDDNRLIYREMRRLSEGRILIFPTASSEPFEVGEETQEVFRIHGFDCDVAHVSVENALESAFDDSLIAKVADYGSAYFTGGDQANILQALVQNGAETPLLKALREMVAKGGLLAGSSAGAAMMSSDMIMGGTSFEAVASGVTEDPESSGILMGKGLGFFEHGVIDQHFIKRGRLARLVVAMAHSGRGQGFGIDENTALIVEGIQARVVGEYGVFFIDMRNASIDLGAHAFDKIRLDYLDDGDVIDLKNFTVTPSESKRKIKKNEIAYRASAGSHRNAFGAYAIYDMVARLALGDPTTYTQDELLSFDTRAKTAANVVVKRVKRKTRCLVANSESGYRITATNLLASIKSETLDSEAVRKRMERASMTLGLNLSDRSTLILIGSSPLYFQPEQRAEFLSMVEGPVGVIGAASFEANKAAEEHVAFFQAHGIEAVDLNVSMKTIDGAVKDDNQLRQIESMRTIVLCGGNQIRLVDTLRRRGEQSAVLRALSIAYANGATLVASSGAASAMPDVMISGGSTQEALRYGVASDLNHDGLVVQQGIGVFAGGIVDQNILTGKRLGRLVVACAEENERFGYGICEDSALVARRSGNEFLAIGRHGFVQVETDPVKRAPQDDRFIVKDIRLRMIAPGDCINLQTGAVKRADDSDRARLAFDRLTDDLQREGTDIDRLDGIGRDPSLRHAIGVQLRRTDPMTALLDLECAREEHDQ
ncbi:MAG: cyanophycinase [Pseudomonadota bacterium]